MSSIETTPAVPESGPDRWRTWWFESMAGYGERTARQSPVVDRLFRIGGRAIRFRFASPGLAASLTRAFAHLAADEAEPELTISLWDADAPGGPPPLLLKAYLSAVASNWWEFLNARGELLEFHCPPLMGAYHPGSEVFSLLDAERDLGLYWKRNPERMPYYETGSPLRTMLHWWFREQGMQFVHAAAVGMPTGGVLLAGKGGSGKSTSALACLGSGLQYAGDDYCVASLQPRPSVFSLYNTCKLVGEADLARFPSLDGRIWNTERAEGDKPTVFLHEHWPEQVSPGFPLKAILVPKVTGRRDTALVPASRMEALTALGPSTLAQLPSSNGQDLSYIRKLIEALPVYRLEAGTDLVQIPAVIQEFLARTDR
ncbi:MAG: serine kinase [Acidobacteria bacterium]|nr:serine kinase [Acidobacteriota bacterium]